MAVLSRLTVEFARSARWCLGACVALYCLVAPVATQPPSPAAQILSAGDVTAVLNAAMASLSDETMAVAVVDRAGWILGVVARAAAATALHNGAVSLARTGALFPTIRRRSRRARSASSAASISRRASEHANAALYGIENTNRGCRSTSRDAAVFNAAAAAPRSIAGTFGPTGAGRSPSPLACRPSDTTGCSPGITTGKPMSADGAGLPLHGSGQPGGLAALSRRTRRRRHRRRRCGAGPRRYAAALGSTGARDAASPCRSFPDPLPTPGAVFIDGLRLPFFSRCTSSACILAAVRSRPPAQQRSASGVVSVVSPARRHQAPEDYVARAARERDRVCRRTHVDEVRRIVDQSVARAHADARRDPAADQSADAHDDRRQRSSRQDPRRLPHARRRRSSRSTSR